MNVRETAWWAAVRLVQQFYAITPEERDDQCAVLRENERLLTEQAAQRDGPQAPGIIVAQRES